MKILCDKTNIQKNKQSAKETQDYFRQNNCAFNNEADIEIIRELSEAEQQNTSKTSFIEDKSKNTLTLEVKNLQKTEYTENEGKLSVISGFKGHTAFENDAADIKDSMDLHGKVLAEKHGSPNIKSNIKLTALSNDIRYAAGDILGAAHEREFDCINGGYVKKALKPLDISDEKDIACEIENKLFEDKYNEAERTELNRLKEVNMNTINRKEQLKTEVEAKVRQVIKSDRDNNTDADFFYFLFKRKPQEEEDTTADEE